MLRECLVPGHAEPSGSGSPVTVRRAATEEDAMTATQVRASKAGDKLLGRVAFVTGGTRGIGAAISRSLAAQGADVAAGYSGNQQAAEGFAQDFSATFPDRHVTVHRGDIGSAEDCRRCVDEVIDRHGRLDILVNNAGITADRTVLKMVDEDWRRVIDVNLSGAFYLSQAALVHMLGRGSGRIVMISSVIGETGGIGQVNYASAKSGLFGLTKTLAREAAMQLQRAGNTDGIGVTVNAVTPGYIGTEMLNAVPEKVLDGLRAKIPLGRLGQPEEVARVVHFLAADASSYITGQVWGVNGGLDM
jgi:NAD(P)-dependent dehydrogenase (short-subunit alcohol dehydrogenase family)